MKPFNYKILNLIVFSTLLIFYTVFAKASVETYSVFAKLPLLGEVQVQNIIVRNDFGHIKQKRFTVQICFGRSVG